VLVLGHVLQVFHYFLISLVAFLIAYLNYWWFGLICCLAVFIIHEISGGICPVTLFSNLCFKHAGKEEYDSAHEWLSSFVGHQLSTALFILLIMLLTMTSFATGFYFRP